jgi:CHAT domain-containing protein
MPCELAVLSACDTGHGRFVRGEGMLAFSRAFMAAGARSVCASFWPVDDRSAPVLMEAFYRHLLEPECSREDALARAQAEMLKGPFSHPYHWASFGIWGKGGKVALVP